jgi:hydrogenase expression/formation protein HypE
MRLRAGKLPPRVLRQLLRFHGAADRRVIVGPRFGEDAAVINLGAQYLILKSDPVTFTADEVGWYAVHVNANDVAVMGARPAWFQATIIVPTGSTDALVRRIFQDIDRSARALGIAVTGGHTEVSTAVRQPIVAGDMQGIVDRGRLITSAGAQAGDVVVLTQAAGIEGTSIIARSFAAAARKLLGPGGQRTAARFHHQPGISVVREALLAAGAGATAMHDPTEGGVAAALFELASASRRRLAIDLDRIPVLPPTQRLCAHFGLRPLGLIASGALLITLPERAAPSLLRRLQRRRIPATCIGQVSAGRGIVARRDGKRVRFEWSERDELARLDWTAVSD